MSREREGLGKGASLYFYDKDDGSYIGEIAQSEIKYLPRIGEAVILPYPTGGQGANVRYIVTHISHSFIELSDNPGQTELLGITAFVRVAEAGELPSLTGSAKS